MKRACLIVIVTALIVSVFGPLVSTHSPDSVDLSLLNAGPQSGHPLGFDGQGRDIATRLLFGARTALLGPLAVVAVAILIGTLVATAAAWRGGRVDQVASAVLDVLFSFPGILLAVLAATIFGAGLPSAAGALAIAYMPYVARVLRGAAVRERAQPYIAALEVQGVSGVAISARHLVRNIAPLIVAQATTLFGYATVDLAAISFIGLGVQGSSPDWGVMVAEGRAGLLDGHPATSLAAVACIMVVVIAVSLLGERLSDEAEGR